MKETIMNFNLGDTTFISLVNAHRYNSFVDEEWTFEQLKEHFELETKNNNILVLQMTNEGVECDWKIEINNKVSSIKNIENCFRKDKGYISVSNNELYLVEYNCLTMAAQFDDEKVPDEDCSKFKIELENGNYLVDIIQFYDADRDIRFGNEDVDIKFVFTKIDTIEPNKDKIYWGTY